MSDSCGNHEYNYAENLKAHRVKCQAQKEAMGDKSFFSLKDKKKGKGSIKS